MEKYDLIVVGSGPGGQRAAIQAAKFGKRAALVEKLEVIGGTAINTGTIPSKTIREAVLHLSGYQYQSIYGVNYRATASMSLRGPQAFSMLITCKSQVRADNPSSKPDTSSSPRARSPRFLLSFLSMTRPLSIAIKSFACRRFPSP